MNLQSINKCQDLFIKMVKSKDLLVEIYLSTGFKVYGKIIESDIYSIIFKPYSKNNEEKEGITCIFKSHITNIHVRNNIPFKSNYKKLNYILSNIQNKKADKNNNKNTSVKSSKEKEQPQKDIENENISIEDNNELKFLEDKEPEQEEKKQEEIPDEIFDEIIKND